MSKKNLLTVCLVFLIIGLAQSATAETVTAAVSDDAVEAERGARFGLALELTQLGPNFGALVVPIEWRRFRLEPRFAAGVATSTHNAGDGSGGTRDARYRSTDAELGLGLHWLVHRAEKTHVYLGVAAGGTYMSFDAAWVDEPSDARTEGLIGSPVRTWGVTGGPLLGFEYRPWEQLGIGVEGGVLGRASLFESGTSGIGLLGLGTSGSARTRGVVKLRYIF